jgi:inner membrane protein
LNSFVLSLEKAAMQWLISLLFELGPWNWFLAAVALFIFETIVPGVHFLWFGIAAAVVGLLAIVTSVAWQWQFIGFAIMSILAVFSVSRCFRPEAARSDQPDLNVRAAQYLGRIVTVEDAIAGGRGRVRVGDSLWAAEGPDLPVGARARVIASNGTVLVVEAN